jgi:hypothetical protein
MKKNLFYAFAGAIALSGAVGFSSCSSSEDTVDVNPGYDEKKGEVPVNFVFNVSTGNTATTRMAETTVQALSTNVFRGMDKSALMSFKLNSGGLHVPDSTSVTAQKQFSLGAVLGQGAIGPNSVENSRRILELSVPVGTNTLMFWGKAQKTGSDNEQGKIDFHEDTNLRNTYFSLCPILPEGDARTTFDQYRGLIEAVLNKIMASSYTGKASFGTSESRDVTDLKWSDYAEVITSGTTKTLQKKATNPGGTGTISELGEILANAFVTFNTINTGELRAGSGLAVERMLVDLYTVIDKVASATPTNLEEVIAKAVGEKIRTNMQLFLNANKSFSCWAKIDDVKSKSGLTSEQMNKLPSNDTSSDYIELQHFPAILGMPDGSTVLTCEITTDATETTKITEVEYAYRGKIPTYNMGGTTVVADGFNIYDYMYPAELCYFGNSPIRVSEGTHTTDNPIYPQGTTDWDTDNKWLADGSHVWTKNGTVLSSIRSVGMQENINYGTSLLKATVRYGAATLKDNNKGLHPDEDDNTLTANANLFTLKGILIGGQYQTMGWNYVAKSGSKENCMIYDNALTDGTGSTVDQKTIPAYTATVTDAKSKPNYTLVWDNWNVDSKDAKQNIVYVALEFVNNGDPFWGEKNLIPTGGTFYISGKLDPDEGLSETDRSAGITWPSPTTSGASESGKTYYALPPYNADGSTIKKRRVFIQDYMTEANFVIGAESLKKAMVTVPDLRSAHMSVGLSVDLKWQTGLSFQEIELGK